MNKAETLPGMLALVCNFSIWERFLVLRSSQSREDYNQPTTEHDVLVLRQVSTQWCQRCSGPVSWRRGEEEHNCACCPLWMDVILGATKEIQEASKEYRRGEFSKGFSYLMGMYISTCLSAFAWFDPDTCCQLAHCECYCCWPCPCWSSWHSLLRVRWGLPSHLLAIPKPGSPAQTAGFGFEDCLACFPSSLLRSPTCHLMSHVLQVLWVAFLQELEVNDVLEQDGTQLVHIVCANAFPISQWKDVVSTENKHKLILNTEHKKGAVPGTM